MTAQQVSDGAPQETFNVHQAKTHLSELLVRVEQGERFTIARAGKPVAQLVAFERPRRKFGVLDLDLEIPDRFFFDPLTEEELSAWE